MKLRSRKMDKATRAWSKGEADTCLRMMQSLQNNDKDKNATDPKVTKTMCDFVYCGLIELNAVLVVFHDLVQQHKIRSQSQSVQFLGNATAAKFFADSKAGKQYDAAELKVH